MKLLKKTTKLKNNGILVYKYFNLLRTRITLVVLDLVLEI